MLARLGIGPAHLLTTRGRKSGRPRTNPVVLVKQDHQQWLVVPYGTVSWVLNARAAGQVTLRRGPHSQATSLTQPVRHAPACNEYRLGVGVMLSPALWVTFGERPG